MKKIFIILGVTVFFIVGCSDAANESSTDSSATTETSVIQNESSSISLPASSRSAEDPGGRRPAPTSTSPESPKN